MKTSLDSLCLTKNKTFKNQKNKIVIFDAGDAIWCVKFQFDGQKKDGQKIQNPPTLDDHWLFKLPLDIKIRKSMKSIFFQRKEYDWPK